VLDEKVSLREGTGILLALASVVALSWQGSTPQPQTINNLEHEIHH
jgi:hypothetical protein